jgi:Leucine-rich repeat (LRR) protein
MPPMGKHQLTEQEITTLKQWIEKGASFEDELDTIYSSKKETIADSIQVVIPKKVYKFTMLPKEVKELNMPSPVSNETIDFFKHKNIVITSMGEGSNFLMANFINAVPFNSNDLVDLSLIKNQLSILKLSNLPIKDSDLKTLSNLKNITKLNLENTAITDESIAYLKELPKLEQLNLYGTNLTDKSLSQMELFKNLSVIYLWKTKVTKEGIEHFVKVKPNVKIETGNFKFQKK